MERKTNPLVSSGNKSIPLLLVYSTIIYSLHAYCAQTEDKTVNKKDHSLSLLGSLDAEADFLIKGHINNYLITILNNPQKENYIANEAKIEGPVVAWPRA